MAETKENNAEVKRVTCRKMDDMEEKSAWMDREMRRKTRLMKS